MEYKQFDGSILRCLYPANCKCKFRKGTLVASSKNARRNLVIEIDPDSSGLEAIEFQILAANPIPDKHRNFTYLRRGKFVGKWPGIEAVMELEWFHDGTKEFGWWLLLDIEGHRVFVQLGDWTDFASSEDDWLNIVHSIEIQ